MRNRTNVTKAFSVKYIIAIVHLAIVVATAVAVITSTGTHWGKEISMQ